MTGEAKIELRKEIEKRKALYVKIAGVESADKITGPQIVSRTINFFKSKELICK